MPAGSLCDAGLTRRAPGTGPPTLRHGPSQPYDGHPIRRGTPPEEAKTLRLVGAALDRVFLVGFAFACSRLIPVAAWVGGLHTSAQHCSAGRETRGTCSLVIFTTDVGISQVVCLNPDLKDFEDGRNAPRPFVPVSPPPVDFEGNHRPEHPLVSVLWLHLLAPLF